MDIDALITAIFQRPPVWDKKHRFHANRAVLEKCWKEISEETNVDENKARKKWKYLRDQFSVELGKIPPPISDDAGDCTSTSRWPYFNLLMFLKDTVKPRLWTGNSSKLPTVDTILYEGSSDEMEASVGDAETSGNYSKRIPNTAHQKRKISEETGEEKGRKRKHDPTDTYYNYALLDSERQKPHYIHENIKQQHGKDTDDEDLFFFKSLLPHVRKIPQSKKLCFRNHVQELVERFTYQQNFSSYHKSNQSFQSSFPASSENNLQSSLPEDAK